MRHKRIMKVAATVLGGCMAVGSGSCLPDDYWADFVGDTLSGAAGQILEDVIGDAVDAVDPAIDVNQL